MISMDASRLLHRKANKPLMEKKRRARINKSLLELKSLLIERMNKKSEPTGHSKWEKADILEMTVQYVHTLRNKQNRAKTDQFSVGEYIGGYSECIRQMHKYNSGQETPDKCELTQHLLHHLHHYSNSNSNSTSSHDESETHDDEDTHSQSSILTPKSSTDSESYSCSTNFNHSSTPQWTPFWRPW